MNLLRTAAGVRWCIKFWDELETKLNVDGTWYFIDKFAAIMLQGLSARLDRLIMSEEAYTTWVDCLVCMRNPTQRDIDQILDPANIPKGLLDRDVTLWPGNPAESRARLQAIVDRELPRLEALEETLRVQHEVPARAEAKEMALAMVTPAEQRLLAAGRMHELSYQRALTALLKALKQPAAASAPAPAAGELDEGLLDLGSVASAPAAAEPAPATAAWPVVGRSEQRSVVGDAMPPRRSSPPSRLAGEGRGGGDAAARSMKVP